MRIVRSFLVLISVASISSFNQVIIPVANQLNIVVVNKLQKKAVVVHVAIPSDSNINK